MLKNDFDQQTACRETVCWSKYTTLKAYLAANRHLASQKWVPPAPPPLPVTAFL